ncbi:hypothetical protein CBL_04192 [Carabus blaptoides fortunei]
MKNNRGNFQITAKKNSRSRTEQFVFTVERDLLLKRRTKSLKDVLAELAWVWTIQLRPSTRYGRPATRRLLYVRIYYSLLLFTGKSTTDITVREMSRTETTVIRVWSSRQPS